MSLRNLILLPVLVAASAGCSSEEATFSMTLEVRLEAHDGQLDFISPNAVVQQLSVDELVGRTYYFATFEGGFSPGNDPVLHEEYGTIPASLSMDYTTPAEFENGVYDLIFVGYSGNDVPPEGPAVTPSMGDVAAFTADQSAVREGDPELNVGTIRFVVDGADTTIRVVNRAPEDPNDMAQIAASFNDTVMILP